MPLALVALVTLVTLVTRTLVTLDMFTGPLIACLSSSNRLIKSP